MKKQKKTENLQKHKTGEDPKLIIILGAVGVGKSSLIKQFIQANSEAGRRALICTPHFEDFNEFPLIENNADIVKFEGVRKQLTYDLANVENVGKYYRKGLLVLDDCRYYLPDRSDGIVKQLALSRRHWMTDVIVAAHAFDEVPKKLFSYASDYILFETIGGVEERRKSLRNYEFVKRKVQEINKKALNNKHYYEILPV